MLATDTFARFGGIQQFNRRMLRALESLVHPAGSLMALILRDPSTSLPQTSRMLSVATPGAMLLAVFAYGKANDLLVIGHLNLLPAALLARLANPRIMTVLVVHGAEAWNDPLYRRKRFYEPLLLGAVDRIASVSQYTAQRMHEQFGVAKEKFVVFPNAVDGPVVPREAAAAGRTLLAVTRMALHDRGKNLDQLLRAFAALSPSLHDANLEIVGDGPLRSELEALAASLGISQRVCFLGRVSDDELAQCYARAAAFVLPSSKEGFGIVYLEAWKHGLPVICGSEGASREIVSDGVDGLVVDPTDIGALARAMELLLTKPDIALQMGRRGAEKVAGQYLDVHFRQNLERLIAWKP